MVCRQPLEELQEQIHDRAGKWGLRRPGSQPRLPFNHPAAQTDCRLPAPPPPFFEHQQIMEDAWSPAGFDVPSQGCTGTSVFVDLPGFSLLTRMF